MQQRMEVNIAGMTSGSYFKLVIITDFGKKTKFCINAENTADPPKTLQVSSLCCFHNLKPLLAGFVDKRI